MDSKEIIKTSYIVTISTNEKRRVDCIVFNPVKRMRGKPTFEEVVKRELMVNNIFEDLIFNQAEWHHVIM